MDYGGCGVQNAEAYDTTSAYAIFAELVNAV